jgi:ribosomal protein L7Ae-like RNA K-turn-binding protein
MDSQDETTTQQEEKTILTYEEQLGNCNEIATPMASKKLVKRLYKSIKQAKTEKNMLRRGLKEVSKALKKKEKGFVVFAGDVRPVEIYCHLMACCEDNDIPYVFSPSKQLLGNVINSKRPTCVVLVRKNADESFDKAMKDVKKLTC